MHFHNRTLSLAAAVLLVVGLAWVPTEARGRSGGGSGKSTASRGSSSGGSSMSRGSSGSTMSSASRGKARAQRGSSGGSSASRGSRASGRSRASAGSPSSGRTRATKSSAYRGSTPRVSANRQVARGRATYGNLYARGRGFFGHPGFWGGGLWGGGLWGGGFWGGGAWAGWHGPWGWGNPGFWGWNDPFDPYFLYRPFGWTGGLWAFPHQYNYYAWENSARPYWDEELTEDWDGEWGGDGIVETRVRPKKAEVWLDGEHVGYAKDYNGRWDQLYVGPGVRQLEFRKEGYQTWRTYIEVRPGREYRIEETLTRGEGMDPRSQATPPAPRVRRRATQMPREPRLEPRPEPKLRVGSEDRLRTGMLHLEVRPSDAVVYLDGEFLARASELDRLHGALPVAVGRHRIEVTRPGYREWVEQIDVETGEPLKLQIDLERR